MIIVMWLYIGKGQSRQTSEFVFCILLHVQEPALRALEAEATLFSSFLCDVALHVAQWQASAH